MRIYNINNRVIKVDSFKIDYSDGRRCTDKNGSFCQDSCGRCPYIISN